MIRNLAWGLVLAFLFSVNAYAEEKYDYTFECGDTVSLDCLMVFDTSGSYHCQKKVVACYAGDEEIGWRYAGEGEKTIVTNAKYYYKRGKEIE